MSMKITLARHYGMCFGVRDALKAAEEAAGAGPLTVLGELVHNPVVEERMRGLGVRRGRLEAVGAGVPDHGVRGSEPSVVK